MSLGERIRLISNSLSNMAPPIASAIMGLATVSLQLAYLPSHSYALWISLHAIIATASMIDFGMGWSLTYIVAGDTSLARPATRRVLNGSAAVVLALGLIGGLIVLGFALMTIQGLHLADALDQQSLVLSLAAAAIFFFGRIMMYVTSVLYGTRQFGYTGLLATGQTLAVGTSTILAAYFTGNVVAIALWHVAIAAFFTLLGLWVVGRSNRALSFAPSIRDIPDVFALTRFSLSSQCADLATTASWDIVTLLLGFLIGPQAVVAFHVGIRSPKTIASVLTRAAEVMMPIGSATAKLAHASADRQTILEGVRWTLVIAVPASAILFAMAPYILQVWLHQVDSMMLSVLRIGLVAVLIEASGMAILYFAWGRGAMSLVLGATIGKVVIGIAGLIIFIPTMGASGAAMGILAGTAATTLWLTGQMPAEISRIGNGLRAIAHGFILPGMLAGIGAMMVEGLFEPPSILGLGIAITTGLTIFLALFFSFGAQAHERELAYTFCLRTWRALAQGIKILRGILAHIRPLRSFWHALIELGTRASGHWRHESAKSDALFNELADPWGYARHIHQNRLARAEFLIDSARRSAGISPSGGRILEIGCAEGDLTERLIGRAREIETIDISKTALMRTSSRVGAASNIGFAQCDITTDPLPGNFDLVIVDGILDYFRSARLLAELSAKIRETVRPGGYILIGNTRQHEIIENANWARWFVRGGLNVNRYVVRKLGFQTVTEDNDAFYSYILVKRAA